MARLSEFYQLSSVLTGLSNAKLRELDSNLEHYKLLTDNIHSDVLESMFDNYVTLRKQLTKDHCAQIKKHFITSAKFGPIACNIIKLWQTKQWHNYHNNSTNATIQPLPLTKATNAQPLV